MKFDMFKNLSIGMKITGSMATLLFVMLFINASLFLKSRETDNVLDVMTNHVIPLNNVISTLSELAMEQQLIVERILGQYERSSPDNSRIEQGMQRFHQIGVQVDKEITESTSLLNGTIQGITRTEDAIEIVKVISLLSMIERDHQGFHDHVLQIFEHHNQHNISAFNIYVNKLNHEIDRLDKSLDKATAIIEGLSHREADEALVGELKLHHVSVIIGLAAFIAGMFIAPIISRRIVSPLNRVIAGTKEIAQGNLNISIPVESKDEVGILSAAFNTMAEELRHKEQIKEAFGKYIDPRIVESILQDGSQLDMQTSQKRLMTIFFSDIEKFSTIAESLTPNGLVTLMNKYFSTVSQPIVQHHGVIDKFIGDAVMAFWGPPFTGEESHAKLACRATLEQFEKLDALNENIAEIVGFRKGVPQIRIRVGICTGEVIAGNIGSNNSRSYTVMGDTVNIAARLESTNKQFGTRILLSELSNEMVSDEFETRKIDNIVVVGKAEPVYIYELLGEKGKVEPRVIEMKTLYETAYDSYLTRDWEKARELLSQSLDIHPGDGPSRVLLERIEQLVQTPPPADWDGVWRLSAK